MFPSTLRRCLIVPRALLHNSAQVSMRAYFIFEDVQEANQAECEPSVQFQLPVLKSKFLPDTTWNVTEPICHFYARLQNNINITFDQKFEQKQKRAQANGKQSIIQRLRVLDVRLDHEGRTIPDSDPLSVLQARYSQTKLGSLTFNLSMVAEEVKADGQIVSSYPTCVPYPVHINPARIKNLSLDLVPMTGCPILPQLDAFDMSFEQSKFQWFVSNERMADVGEALTWPDRPTYEGLVFYPEEEHMGHMLRVSVIAINDRGELGLAYHKPIAGVAILNDKDYDDSVPDFFQYPSPIRKGPRRSPMKDRIAQLGLVAEKDPETDLRVMSYNILADMYSRTKEAARIIFPHCPPHYLDFRYRLPLVLQELELYQPDLLCLQEVDRHVFNHYLVPFAKFRLGMRGEICYKRLYTLTKPDSQSDGPSKSEESLIHPAVARPDSSVCELDKEKA
ncbi:Phosphodiesterase 12, partial [Cichlidogyrus casuarinus]